MSLAEMREVMDTLQQISGILGTGLTPEMLTTVVQLCELGVNPEALASVIRELRGAAAALEVYWGPVCPQESFYVQLEWPCELGVNPEALASVIRELQGAALEFAAFQQLSGLLSVLREAYVQWYSSVRCALASVIGKLCGATAAMVIQENT